MMFLKQSIAVTVKIGPFIDDTDGKTAETALTISQADVRLSKNGANIAQKGNVTSCTHDELGIYGCPLSTIDIGTLGILQLWVHETGALPVWHEYMVVPANVWDSWFGADYQHVNVKEISEDSVAADNLESACDNYSATRGLAGTALPAAAADAAGGLPISDVGGLDLDTQLVTDIDAILADTNELQADWTNAGRLDTLLDAIKAVTDALPNAGALNDLATILADTNELQIDWTNAGRLDVLLDAIKVTTDSLTNLATLVDAVWDEDVDVTHQVAGSAGKKLDDAGAAADPWATAIPGAYGAGTAGKILGDNINAPIATVDTVVDAIKAVTDALPNAGALSDLAAILTDTGTTLPASLATIVGYIDTEVAAILADTDELQIDWADGGRLDLLIDAIKVVTDALPDAGALNDLAAILADTAVIGALGAGLSNIPWNASWDAEVQSEVTDALVAYDPPTKAEMDTGHGLLATEAKQDIIDTAVDAIKAKTDNQPAGVQKNVALSNFCFVMLLSDHVTPATGKTITGTISKDGGAFNALTNAEAEIANGVYKVDLTQAEMNADTIVLRFTATISDDTLITIVTSA